MKTTAKLDVSEAIAGLDKIDKFKYPLARSMAVAGGQLLRDEAKIRAPVGRAEETAMGGGSIRPGALRDSIYLAFRDGESTETTVKYSVSWNASQAPHGHLLEFGRWQPFPVFFGAQGWRTRASGKGKRAKGVRLQNPKWVSAHPFLRPAYDASLPRLHGVMVQRGRARLSELLRDELTPDSSV